MTIKKTSSHVMEIDATKYGHVYENGIEVDHVCSISSEVDEHRFWQY